MKISDDAKFILAQIAPWAAQNSGTSEIARNLVHWFGILSTKPGAFRIAVKFKGETKRGQHEEAGMVDRRWWIGFSYGQSMQLEKGRALVDGQAGGRPLYDLVEELREVIRGLNFDPISTEGTANYLGTHELAEIPHDKSALIDGFYLEFTLGVQLPAAIAAQQTEGQ